jgi:hypothetical protein
MRKLIAIGFIFGCHDDVHVGHTGPIGNYEQVLTSDMDLVFMIDDSSSMTTVQQNLAQNFPTFIQVLQQLPGGLPNVHIGIVTSSMGAGAFTASVPGCTSPGGGRFIDAPRVVSCSAQLNSGQHFIVANADGSANNFTGDLATLFSCLAQVGDTGCGFEHQLAAVEAALGSNAPPENAGFLRDYAFLGLVLITNEDDCSVPANSQLFDPSQNSNADPLGPLSSFRCPNFGLLCNGQMLPRTAGGPFTNCVSNDARAQTDPLTSLVPVQHYIDAFRALKNPPEHVRFSAIAAPANPMVVVSDQATGFAELQHSCSSQNGTFGDPAVRIGQVVDAFGANGSTTSICNDSYADAMNVIASGLAGMARRQCVGAPPASNGQALTVSDGEIVDPARVDCSVALLADAGTPTQHTTATIPPCGGQNAGLCWRIVGDGACASHVRVTLCPNGACTDGVPSGQAALLRCSAVLSQ